MTLQNSVNKEANSLWLLRQPGRPSSRADGSLLQVGDIWQQTGTISAHSEWVWNGQHWLSRTSRIVEWASTSSTAVTGSIAETTIFVPEPGYGLWLHNAKFSWRSGNPAHDATNNFSATVLQRNVQMASASIFSFTTNPTPAVTFTVQEVANEYLLNTDALQVQNLRFSMARNGTATMSSFKLTMLVRLVLL